MSGLYSTIMVWPIQEPVGYTSLDDAFSSMMHFMTISTRKCSVSVNVLLPVLSPVFHCGVVCLFVLVALTSHLERVGCW